jgi:hypothetical protein
METPMAGYSAPWPVVALLAFLVPWGIASTLSAAGAEEPAGDWEFRRPAATLPAASPDATPQWTPPPPPPGVRPGATVYLSQGEVVHHFDNREVREVLSDLAAMGFSIVEEVEPHGRISMYKSTPLVIFPGTTVARLSGSLAPLGYRARLGGANDDIIYIEPARATGDPRVYDLARSDRAGAPRVVFAVASHALAGMGANPPDSVFWTIDGAGAIRTAAVPQGGPVRPADPEFAARGLAVARHYQGRNIAVELPLEGRIPVFARGLAAIHAAAAQVLTSEDTLNVFVSPSLVFHLGLYGPSRSVRGGPLTQPAGARLRPASTPATAPGWAAVDARIYADEVRQAGGDRGRIATVFVRRADARAGELVLTLSPEGMVASNGAGGPSDFERLQSRLADLGAGPPPEHHTFAVWVHFADEDRSDLTDDALVRGLVRIQLAAARGLPADSTVTIFIVLDSLDNALAALPPAPATRP